MSPTPNPYREAVIFTTGALVTTQVVGAPQLAQILLFLLGGILIALSMLWEAGRL